MTTDLVLRKRISARSFVVLHIGLALLAVLLWAVGFGFGVPVPAVVIVLVGLIPLLVGILSTWLVRVNTEYRLFQDSLEVESGIIARRIDNLQLFRVRDLGLSQSVLGRILGYGNVSVVSTDQSTPHFVIRGVDEPRALYETLRSLVAKSQATRRTMIVEEEPPPGGGER